MGRSIPYFEPANSGEKAPAAQTPLGKLRIAGVKPIDWGRTLLLATDPHPRAARYDLVLGRAQGSESVLPTISAGVEVAWSEDGKGDPGIRGGMEGMVAGAGPGCCPEARADLGAPPDESSS